MRRKCTWAFGLALVMVLSAGGFSMTAKAVGTNETQAAEVAVAGSEEEEEVELDSKLATYSESKKVSDVVTDSNLLNAIATAVRGNASTLTFSELRSYTGDLDLSDAQFSTIPDYVFEQCNFSSVKLPDTLEKIGQNAFASCDNLIHVNSITADDTLPKGLTSVSQKAFLNCTALTSITMDLENANALDNAVSLFSGCSKLEKIIIGNKVAHIPSNAFEGAGKETSAGVVVTFGTGLKSINDNAFQNAKMVKELDLSNCKSLEIISKAAFKNTTGLNTVKLPKTISASKFVIQDEVFFGSEVKAVGITPEEGHIVFPEYVTELGSACFAGNADITDVVLSSKLKYIGDYTFDNCENLKNVSFNNNESDAIFIGDFAFRKTKTDASFLQYMTKLEYIGFQKLSDDVVKAVYDQGSTSKVAVTPTGGVDTSKNNLSVKMSGTELFTLDGKGYGQTKTYNNNPCASEVFANCPNIENVVIPASVKYIGSRAFYFDTSTSSSSQSTSSSSQSTTSVVSKIKTITYQTNSTGSVRTICPDAFAGNQNLTTLVLPDAEGDILWIGSYAFYNAAQLNSVNQKGSENLLPRSMSYLGWGAFYQCTALTNITIQNQYSGDCPELCAKAFEHCTALASAKLPSKITEIPLRFFADTALTAFPEGTENVETIGMLAFFHTPMKTVDLSKLVKLTQIDSAAFAYYDNIVRTDNNNKTISSESQTITDPVVETVILPASSDYKGTGLFMDSGVLNSQAYFKTLKSGNSAENQVYIPDYMTECGQAVFAGTSVTNVIWQADSTGKNQWEEIPELLYSDCEKIEKAEDVLPTGAYVKKLGKGLFSGTNIVSADLSKCTSLELIGSGSVASGSLDGVFENCFFLETVVLPRGAGITIGANTFSNNSKDKNYALKSVDLGSTVKIENSAFKYARGIETITFPETLTQLGTSVFEECDALTTVKFEGNNNLTEIGSSDFKNCVKLVLGSDSKLLEGPTKIGSYAFMLCESLGNVVIGESVVTIDSNAFDQSTIQTISFSKAKNLTTINSSAFQKVKELKDFTIEGTKVTVIPTNMLFDCPDLKTATFGEEIEYISDNALAGCDSFTTLTVQATTSLSTSIFKSIGTARKTDEGEAISGKEKPVTGGGNKITLNVKTPEVTIVPYGRELVLPFYTVINKEKTTKSFTYAQIGDKNSSSYVEEYFKLTAGLSDGYYKKEHKTEYQITNEAFYESQATPYVISHSYGTSNSKVDVETVKITGLKATTAPVEFHLKSNLSFTCGDGTVDIADFEVVYNLSVQDVPIYPVLYSDSAKTVVIPDGQTAYIRATSSGNGAFNCYYNLEDSTNQGGELDTCKVVVTTSNPAVIYPGGTTSSREAVESYTTKATKNASSGAVSGAQFALIPAGVGDAVVTVYPEGYPQYAKTYQYSVASDLKEIQLKVANEYNNQVLAVGTTFNVFSDYTTCLGQKVQLADMTNYRVYTDNVITYTTDKPEYLTVDANGVATVLQKATSDVKVKITAEAPTSVEGKKVTKTLDITLKALVTKSGEKVVDAATGANLTVTKPTTNASTPGEVKAVIDSSASGAVVVPQSVVINDLPYNVTSIDTSGLKGNTQITSVSIQSTSIKSVDNEMFSGCTNLTTVELPESITKIGTGAFKNCTSLTSVTIPASANVTSIEQETFLNCTSLKSVTIPNTVTAINSSAFQNCKSLASVNIPAAVTTIGTKAFSDCQSLNAVSIPNAVTKIGENAFYNCKNLKNVTINAKSSKLTEIATSTFQNCTALTKVTIPNKVTRIGTKAFAGCKKLKTVTLNSKKAALTSIGDNAFQNCAALTKIVLPSKLSQIGTKAFFNCKKLKTITVKSTVLSTVGKNALKNIHKKAVITVPKKKLDSYKVVFAGKGQKKTVKIKK